MPTNETPELRADILKAFGADLNTSTSPNLIFANNALVYPVGRHVALRDIFSDAGDTHKNEMTFIYLDDDVEEITNLNVSQDTFLLLISTTCRNKVDISVYNIHKLSFASLSIFKPKRRIISTKFDRFIYSCFSPDGNFVFTLGEKDKKITGVVYDIQNYQNYKKDNYSPKNIFDLPTGVNKISFHRKVICTSGNNHLSFWFMFENTCKEYKSSVNVSKNYVDHVWIETSEEGGDITLAAVTDANELYIFTAMLEVNKLRRGYQDDVMKIERFTIKQLISDLFMTKEINEHELEKLQCTAINTFGDGNLVIGSNRGNILFVEKSKNGEYVPIRYTMREKESAVRNFAVNSMTEQTLAISFSANEIAYISLKDLLGNLKNEKFDIKFNVVCDGFHNGPITTMDVARQRPIIVTTSKKDRTVRVWNYLTGHCEYCKIILEEKDNTLEKELEILSVAIHPNGYYIAISDIEMIRFFHLCYKELRYYNNDQVTNEPSKQNCTLLKFSNEGHLLAAVSEKKIFLIRSHSRETVKEINTPHAGQIVSLFFHQSDNFLYSSSTDGVVVQYNLFDFNYVKVANKFVNYSCSVLCTPVYHGTDINNGTNNKKKEEDEKNTKVKMEDNIISCGVQKVDRSIISRVNFDAEKTEEISQCDFTMGEIEVRANSLCDIKTKRFDINAIAIGTEDGSLCLYSPTLETEEDKEKKKNQVKKEGENDFDDSEGALVPQYDYVRAHTSKVNFLYYSRDTNLLFSAGDDGNLFIYAIYEYPDGENAVFEDNKNASIQQLNSILDEGLGDNVLMNLYEIFNLHEQLKNKSDAIFALQKLNDDNAKSFERRIKENELKMNKEKDTAIANMQAFVDDVQLKSNSTVEEYKNRIKDIINENRQKFNDREVYYNDKLTDLQNQLMDSRKENENLTKMNEKNLRDKENDHIKKFKQFEFAVGKKMKEIANENSKLTEQYNNIVEISDRKIKLIDAEHEGEIGLMNEKNDAHTAKLMKDIDDKAVEILRLNENKKKLELSLAQNESDIKKLKEENSRLSDTINTLRNQLDAKEAEKEQLTKKVSDTEHQLQEKSKLNQFSNQLKNELYRRNFELNKNYNQEINTKEGLKENSKVLEKQLEDTILLLINREKEMNKQKILIDELKSKWENQKHETNLIKKDFDNLLKKIYDAFQTNDKKTVMNSMREIYHHYLSEDSNVNFDSNKLNTNVRNELEKQINFLQDQLHYVSLGKEKKEHVQQFHYQRKMIENSMLIEEMTRLKKINTEISNEVKNLRFKNVTLSKENENLKSKINTVNQTENSYQNSLPNNSIQLTNSNTSLPSLHSGILNTYENVYGVNTRSKGDLKGMKNRVFKNGSKISVPNEKLLKYKEMKRIIEGKNDLIQRLSRQNDLLRQMSGVRDRESMRSMSPIETTTGSI